MVTWSALRCGASGESGKKVAAAPLSKTAAAAAAAKTWFAKHPLDYMLHNRFPWKRSGRRSSMWPPYSLRRNLSAAACRPCDRSLTPQDYALCREQRAVHGELWQRWPGRSLTTRCLRHTTRCELHNALHMECNALLTLSNALHKISNALSSLITRYLMIQWIPSISVTWTTKCYLIGQYTYALLLLRNA